MFGHLRPRRRRLVSRRDGIERKQTLDGKTGELKLTVALALIVGVLVVRPSGLFGKPAATRV